MNSEKNPHNLVVGQKLFVVPNRNDGGGLPYYSAITTVGHKWATIEKYSGHFKQRVDLRTLWIDGAGYTSPGLCYLSEQEYTDYAEKKEYWQIFYRALSYSPPPCSLKTLKMIASLMGVEP